MQLSEAALTRIETDVVLSPKSIGPSRWNRGAIRRCRKLKMIAVEALPEKIIIQTEH